MMFFSADSSAIVRLPPGFVRISRSFVFHSLTTVRRTIPFSNPLKDRDIFQQHVDLIQGTLCSFGLGRFKQYSPKQRFQSHSKKTPFKDSTIHNQS